MKRFAAGFFGLQALGASIVVFLVLGAGWQVGVNTVRQMGLPTSQNPALNDLFFGLGSMAVLTLQPIGAGLLAAGFGFAIIATVLFGCAFNRRIRVGLLLGVTLGALVFWGISAFFALALWNTDPYLLWYLIMNPGEVLEAVNFTLFLKILETGINLISG